MRIYYDCEFLENGRTIAPISIGMVAEDGRELYRVFQIDDTIDVALKNLWLRDNVIAHLPVDLTGSTGYDWDWDTTHPDWVNVKSTFDIRMDVERFIHATPEAELWAWYGAYDHVMYAQLFGKMIDLPKGFPMWTNDLRQEAHRLGLGEEEIIPAVPHGTDEHNALADARWNLRLDRWLTEWAVGGGNAR